MIIRGARDSDIPMIEELYKKMYYHLDIPHIESLLVAEEGFEPVAILCFTTVLEGTFLTVDGTRNRTKIEALKKLIFHGTAEIKDLGYTQSHAFANDKIESILIKHFDFKPGVGRNLVLFVE